jgi:predicted GIY-YIG superfamily endonuclease
LIARLAEMGDSPDHQLLAAEVLGIRGAPVELARKLVAQALVIEDRREAWRQAGERICRDAPATAGVYLLRDADGEPLYVGKAINLRRRLRAHFAEAHWRSLKAGMSRAAAAEWREVGSEIEALLREAALIRELRPPVNVQVGRPGLETRAIPRALVRDVLLVLPSIETDSVELAAARADGGWIIQRSRRNGADLGVHSRRLKTFFKPSGGQLTGDGDSALVFSWLAKRGAATTRLDPHDCRSASELAVRLNALFADDRLFVERLDQR